MKGLIIAIGLALAVLSAACIRPDPYLNTLANTRLYQLEQCDCASHRGIDTIQPFITHQYAELIIGSDSKYTLGEALIIWLGSPRHRAILLDSIYNVYGYAASSNPSATGRYYYVLLLSTFAP